MEWGARPRRGVAASLVGAVAIGVGLASGAVAAGTPAAATGSAAAADGILRLVDGAQVAPLPGPGGGAPEPRAEVEGAVEAAFGKADRVPVIVRLREQVDLPELAARARAVGRARGRAAQSAEVVGALRRTAEATQAGVGGVLRAEEAAGRARDVRSFWVFNGFAATVSHATLDRLAARPDVESIELDDEISLPQPQSEPRFPTWGLEKVSAPKTWGEYGFTGRGVVVGLMDSGVDGGHPALAGRYRGRNGDGESSWYAATGENYPTPGDGFGHGTHVAGTMVGGPPGDVIGVAPGAQWIAAKIFRDSGSTTASIIHDGFQWMLAPGGDPAKAPDVVNNSWGSTATYSTEFLTDVRAWVAAGIFPAFANGNSGPGAGTVGSPGSFPESFGVGATDINDQIASFSSRGPAIWDGVTYVKPQISAPGQQIYSAWPRQTGLDYNTISGTSMATPHLTGVVALLLSAQPDLTVGEVRNVLTASARTEPHMGHLPNNDYGAGIADAYAAITMARFSGTLMGTVTGPSGPIEGASVSVPALGLETTADAAGAYELRVKEGSWQVEVSAYGYVGADEEITIAAQEELTRDFALAAAPVHTLSGTVTAGGSPLAGARVRVDGTPLAPAYTGPDGTFSLEVAAGEYEVSADATGYRRASQHVVLDRDRTVDLALEPLPGAVAVGWREYQNNPARTGLSAEELAAGALTETWSVDLPGQVMFASPVIADGRVHVSFDAGQLRTLDLDDGRTLWTFATGASLRSTPAVADGRVYVGGGDSGVFHALDAATGAPVWSYSTGDRLTYATPTVVDDTVYFGTGWGAGNGGWVYALDAQTGALRWKTFIGAQIFFAPAVGGGKVYAASYDAQRLVALDAVTGDVVWSLTRTTDSFASMPSYDAGRLYVATNNFDTGIGSVLAVEAETGEKVWETTGHGDGAGNAPVVYGDVVVAGSSTNNWVAAYDRATGARRWTSSIGAAVSNSQLGADGVLVGGSQQDHRVWVLDAYGGDLLWDDTLSSNVLSAPAFADGRLVVADRFGVIRAYEAPGSVAGTVTDEAGNPLDAEVRVPETKASVRTDPETGEFALPHRAGLYTVEAYAYGYLVSRADVRIRSGQPAQQDFVLAAAEAGTLRGVVRDEAGDPLADVQVELAGTPLDPVASGVDGSFDLGQVAAGTYRVTARLTGYVPLEQAVTVAAGEETVVDLTLLRYQIAVTGDRDNAITRYLEGKGYRVESTTAAAVADHPGAYRLVVANGSQDDPGQTAFLQLLANADDAETSIVFLDSWGISYGALLHLSKYTGDPTETASGYDDGEVSLVARTAHPLTEGLALGERVPALANNTEWAAFSGYSGRSVADVYIGRAGRVVGSGIGYQPRTFGSVHVLLSLHAATPWTGPTSGWTSTAAKVFDNAVAYGLGATFGAVEGSIEDAAGAPLRAKVTAVGSGETATAGADGTYRLLLPPGPHMLRYELIGYTSEEREVTVAARETTTEDVVLASSGAGGITGIVTSSAGGAPIAGAEVTVLGTSLDPAVTGADGRFSIDGVPGGTYDVQVGAERFRTETMQGVVVVDGAATEIAVQLRPQLRVAVVGDYQSRITNFLTTSEVEATATGWEAVDDLDSYDVLVLNNPTDPGRATFEARLAAIDEAGKSAIWIEGATSTSGGIRLLRKYLGEPAARDFVSSDGDPYFDAVAPGHPLFAGLPAHVQVLVGDEWGAYFTGYSGIELARFGTSELGDLGVGAAYEPRTPSSVRLLLSALGASSLAHPDAGWTDDGKRLFLNAIGWAAAPGLGAVAGRVASSDGDPLDDATVRLVETGQARAVDAGGTFVIPASPGDYTLEVTAFGYQTRQIPVTIEAGKTTQHDVELTLAAVGTITGTIEARGSIGGTAATGPPVEGATVTLVGKPRSTTTAADGSYTLEHVEPGTYDIEVRADGFVRQILRDVEVTAGAATRRDAALRPSPRVAVLDDCQQNSNCVDKMQRYLAEWGYLPDEIDWSDAGRLDEFDLVVLNLGDFPRDDPGAAGLAAFQDAANRAHVPLIWLEQFQRGSIRHLSAYEGDPETVGEGRSQGLVEAEVVAAHPLTAGFGVGERVPIVNGGSFEHTWFDGYSGTTVANLRTATGGLKGASIAYRGRTASSVDVLFSSFAVSFYTWPPVGGDPAQLLTPQAEQLFHNALNWALDAPPLAAEARGTVSSSAGGTLASTVTVLETGKSYPGRAGDGTFLVPLQPGDWTLAVTAFGHQAKQIPVSVTAGDVRNLSVTLQADAIGVVAGTVTDPEGAPVEGASLALEGTPLTAESDAAGAYRIERVPVGEHALVVRKSGFGLQRIPLTVSEGATTRIDVRLAVSRVVAVAGDYLNRITNFLTENGYAPVQWSWTNIQQHIPDLDDVELVILNGSGTQPSSANFTAFVDAAAEAGRSLIFAGQFANGSIRTLRTAYGDPATWAQGFVPEKILYRPSVEHPIFAGFPVGEPIELIVNPGANQQYEQFGGYSGETIATLESATDTLGGGVAYRFATPSSVHVLLGSLGAAVYGSPGSRWTENASRIYLNAVEWALDAAQAEIFGTVSSGGQPVEDAKVTAVEAAVSVRTGSDGGYSLGVPDGTHTVRVEAVGYEPFETTVEVGVEERVRLDAELVPIPRGAIAGTVSDEDGAPLADARVALDGPQEGETSTAADGTFGLADLLPGEYVLTVGTPGYLEQELPVTVERGETTTVSVALHAHDVAVLGDADGALVDFLRGAGVAAEERGWDEIAASAGRYEAIVVNGGEPAAGQFDALVAAADEAGTSLIFTGTWGILNGGLRLLAEHRPDEVELGPQGYRDGAVELTGFDASHPLFAGLSAPLHAVADDGYYGALERYVGPYLADISAEAKGPLGVSVAYDFRSADSVHLLLSAGAASDYIGPGYGWTPAGEQLFLNALAWAREVEQVAPAAPTLAAEEEVVAQSPVTLTGTAEFRSTVTILRGGEQVAEAEPARDGTFSVEVELVEGENEFTATAANYAGSSPASDPIAVTLDTAGPHLEWTPADGSGFFDPHLVVSGKATDTSAGVATVLVNGEEASLTEDGNFAAEVELAEGENELTVVARDTLGNETSETRRVAFFRYGARWVLAGEKGKGAWTAFLDLTDSAGDPVQVDSVVLELVREDGSVAVSRPMQYEDGRYKAKLGNLPGGTYTLRGTLVVSGWNVHLTGPTVVRAGEPAGTTSGEP